MENQTADVLFLSMVAEVSAAEPTGITTTEIKSLSLSLLSQLHNDGNNLQKSVLKEAFTRIVI